MLTKISIKKPYTVIVLILIVMIVGGIAIGNIPIDLLPNIEVPVMVVATVVPGKSPEEVEKAVTSPLEEKLRQINNVSKVNSISSENVSLIVLQFSDKVNLTDATQDITNKVKEVSPKFPSLTMDSIIMKLDPNQQAVMNLAISQDGKSLSDSAKFLNEVANRLKAKEGVASVNIAGAIENMLAVQLDMEYMSRQMIERIWISIGTGANRPGEFDEFLDYIINGGSITPPEGSEDIIAGMIGTLTSMINPKIIETAIAASDFDLPAGQISVGGVSYFVKVGNSVKDIGEFGALPLLTMQLTSMIPDEEKIHEQYNNGKISIAEREEQLKFLEDYLGYRLLDATGKREIVIGETMEKMLREALPDDKEQSLIDSIFDSYEKDGNKAYYLKEGIKSYLEGLEPIKATMSDIAKYTHLDNSSSQHAMIDGAPGILLSILKQPGFSTVAVSQGIRDTLKELRRSEPSLNYIVLYDQGNDINFMLSTILLNLLLGAVFAILILLFFLRDIRPTVTVGISIVISVLGALGLMYLCGVTLNLISMGGLALAVGMLVDNSIVVIENIYRKRREGMSAIKAAYEGTKQVSGAIVSSTITTVVVFLPIMFVNGMVKQIFTDLALTIAFSLGISLLIALTLVPMIASRVLKKDAKPEYKFMEKVKNGYGRALEFAINKKWITIVTVAVLFSVSVVGIFFMNKELFPSTTLENFSISINIDQEILKDKYGESTYNEAINDLIDDVYNKVKLNKNVEHVGMELSQGTSYAGVSIGGGQVVAYVDLKEKYKGKPAKIKKEIEAEVSDSQYFRNGVCSIVDSTTNQLIGDTNTISVSVSGSSLDKMRNTVLGLSAKIASTGYSNISHGLEKVPQEYRLVVDRERAAKYGLLPAHVYLTVAELLAKPGSNVNIKFDNETDNSNIYIYSFDYQYIMWYRAINKKTGEKIKVYLDAEDSTKSKLYFIDTSSGVPVKIYVSESGNEFIGVSNRDIILTARSKELYYDTVRRNELDLVTEKLKFGTILANPQYSVLFTEEQRELLNSGVEVYKLIDFEESCTTDSAGNVLFRDIGKTIPIEIALKDGFGSINHTDGGRTFTIKVKVPEGMSVNKAKTAIAKAVDQYIPPTEVEVTFIGDDEMVTEVFDSLLLILGLAVVLIYLVMVAQFQSIKSPLIIMFTLPLAFTGSILLLWACGMTLSVFAMVGLILLVGLVVNNGIVFVDYVNKLVLSGMNKRDAIIKTGRERLRPILMTALTTITALIATVLDPSPSAESIKPMAVATIGGLAYSTLLTLFFVPIMYDLFNKKQRVKTIKFDDDKEVDIEAEMHLDQRNQLSEVMTEEQLDYRENYLKSIDIKSATVVGESVESDNAISEHSQSIESVINKGKNRKVKSATSAIQPSEKSVESAVTNDDLPKLSSKVYKNTFLDDDSTPMPKTRTRKKKM